MWLGGISCQSVWGMIFQWSSSLKVTIELPATSRHRRDMTERLLKATLSPNQTNKQKNLFWISSLKPKCGFTQNLVGSIRVTCRSKIAKIVLIGNARWPPQLPSWKSNLNFFSWMEMPVDLKLGMKYRVICRSKIAAVQIGNPRWPPRPPKIYFELLLLNWKANWLEIW